MADETPAPSREEPRGFTLKEMRKLGKVYAIVLDALDAREGEEESEDGLPES